MNRQIVNELAADAVVMSTVKRIRSERGDEAVREFLASTDRAEDAVRDLAAAIAGDTRRTKAQALERIARLEEWAEVATV